MLHYTAKLRKTETDYKQSKCNSILPQKAVCKCLLNYSGTTCNLLCHIDGALDGGLKKKKPSLNKNQEIFKLEPLINYVNNLLLLR